MFPNWLTNEYLQPWLQRYYKDEGLKVLKIWAKPASGKGGNFSGVMTRIYVDYQQGDKVAKNQSYIVKQALSPETDIQTAVVGDLYLREMNMFEFILPKMKEILQEAGINGKLTADAIVVDRELSVIILEDLAPLNYINADRVKQLDLDHAKMALEMLARFHAAGIILKQRHPELLAECFFTNLFSRGKQSNAEVYPGLYRAFMRFINTQPELERIYGEKLEKLSPHIMEYGARAYDVTEQELLTLIHGDYWTTNIMYQYDKEGNPQEVICIDFQCSNCTSPVIDLHYFYTTSLREEVKDRELELVEFHYITLKSILQKLSYQEVFPSLQGYQVQFERRRFKSLMANLFKPAMTYNGTEDVSDFADLYSNTPKGRHVQAAIYNNEGYQRTIPKFLALLNSKGVLELQ
ncbi:hypothetical protein KR026_003906 [Drosophila bipectinata]|nr:hypothetical protein KR026_003906 [Drosophila bipectinata]